MSEVHHSRLWHIYRELRELRYSADSDAEFKIRALEKEEREIMKPPVKQPLAVAIEEVIRRRA
jgi:hypothetical protein